MAREPVHRKDVITSTPENGCWVIQFNKEELKFKEEPADRLIICTPSKPVKGEFSVHIGFIVFFNLFSILLHFVFITSSLLLYF